MTYLVKPIIFHQSHKALLTFMGLNLLTLQFLNATENSKTIDLNEVVAKVNGKDITRGAVEQNFLQGQYFLTRKPYTRKLVLEFLINRQATIDLAYQGQLHKDPTVKRKMNDVLYHAKISHDLTDELKKISVTSEEIKNYVAKFPEYRTAQILFRLPPNPPELQVKAAVASMQKVYQKAKTNPENFSQLAKKYSQTQAAVGGGDLGYQPAVHYAPEYFKNIHKLPVGTITAPFRTSFGIHIVKVLGVRGHKKIDKKRYKQIIYDQKRDQILQGYFSKIKSGAKVEILDKSLK